MLTDDEIAGYMGWRGPGAYTEHKMRKVKAAIAEAAARERESNNAEIAGLRDRVERLRGLCKSASGWLLDADDIEHSELILDYVGDMEPCSGQTRDRRVMRCATHCDFERAELVRRATWVCPDCGRDISIEYMYWAPVAHPEWFDREIDRAKERPR